MNPGVTGAVAGSTAAVVAAQVRRRRQAEEESMTTYRGEDLEGWEFKILRATSAKFKDPLAMRLILEEEAEAGWELIEKFDDRRVRLKRRVEWRDKDRGLARDAYRTWVGMSDNRLGFLIAGLIGVGIVLVALIAAAVSS